MEEVPWKMGTPSSISPKMHPIDQMSVPYVYAVDPSKISGDLYHLVAT